MPASVLRFPSGQGWIHTGGQQAAPCISDRHFQRLRFQVTADASVHPLLPNLIIVNIWFDVEGLIKYGPSSTVGGMVLGGYVKAAALTNL